MALPSIDLFGLRFANLTLREAVLTIRGALSDGQKLYVLTPNVDHIVRLQSDAAFRKAYEDCGLILPDGMPLVWASRLLGAPLKERITGVDLFFSLAHLAAKDGFGVFLLGGKAEILQKARDRLGSEMTDLRIVGSHHGYFSSYTEIIQEINSAKPDLLFIGMGSPKQEIWIYEHFEELEIKVALCVGGTFDILAGEKRRAPVVLQRIGMEWFWRFLQEPKRLWRRYLLDDMLFFKLVYLEKARAERKRAS